MSNPGSGGLPYEQRYGLGYLYIDHFWRLPEEVKKHDTTETVI